MEFEHLQKIWNSQTNETYYMINEQALHSRILAKQNSSLRISNISELLLIAGNTLTALFLILSTSFSERPNIFLYVLAVWMLLTAVYSLAHRLKRTRESKIFDRSMIGDLDHALSAATYQVRLSALMRWNSLPVAALLLAAFAGSNYTTWFILAVMAAFAILHYFSGWEHSIYSNKKKQLELLKKKITDQ